MNVYAFQKNIINKCIFVREMTLFTSNAYLLLITEVYRGPSCDLVMNVITIHLWAEILDYLEAVSICAQRLL